MIASVYTIKNNIIKRINFGSEDGMYGRYERKKQHIQQLIEVPNELRESTIKQCYDIACKGWVEPEYSNIYGDDTANWYEVYNGCKAVFKVFMPDYIREIQLDNSKITFGSENMSPYHTLLTSKIKGCLNKRR